MISSPIKSESDSGDEIWDTLVPIVSPLNDTVCTSMFVQESPLFLHLSYSLHYSSDDNTSTDLIKHSIVDTEIPLCLST